MQTRTAQLVVLSSLLTIKHGNFEGEIDQAELDYLIKETINFTQGDLICIEEAKEKIIEIYPKDHNAGNLLEIFKILDLFRTFVCTLNLKNLNEQ
jgi:hypothetical protein